MAFRRRLDHEMVSEERRQHERDQAYEESLADDLGNEFFLPIHHRPTENLVTDNLEQASVDTHLSSSNLGFRLLQKMGWKGRGLGKDEQGITEPIRAGVRDAKLGVGKQEEDDFYTAEENIHRRKLEVELEETEELTKKREVEAQREHKIQTEVKEIRKTFFCELCNKQYKLAVEFEAHLSSYDHNHRKRFKDMKESQANWSKDDRQKREQIRQEKEMAKMSQLLEAQRQQQQQSQQDQHSASQKAPSAGINAPVALGNQEQRTAFKFGFNAKSNTTTKMTFGGAAKKAKVKASVPVVFQNQSDEDE